MYLTLIKIVALLSEAKNPYQSQKQLKNQILQKERNISEKQLLQANQNHQRGSDFFSASYSGDWLFLALAKEKIGVDIEIIQERTPELLQKYAPELEKHFQKADWQHFYLLRTAKEAILKASNSKNLDLIDEISLLKTEKTSETIGTLKFDRKFTFTFQGKIYEVKS